MNPHLVLATIVMIVAAIIDLRTRRIPNSLLLFAVLAHVALSVLDEIPSLAILEGAIFASAFLIVFLIPSLAVLLRKSIGMGDIKLVLYLILFCSPAIDMALWLVSMSLISALALAFLIISRRHRSSIPFAPVIALATLLAIV